MMAQLMDGTDNVFVLGFTKDDEILPAATPEAVDDMLETSLAIQLTQIDDFIEELARIRARPKRWCTDRL